MNVRIRRIALLVAFSALLVMAIQTGCDELVTEQITVIEAGHPTAEFDVDSGVGCAPWTVQFSDESNGPRHIYIWAFGDGDTLQETIPQDSTIPYDAPAHTYDTSGIYTVSLTIFDTINDGIDTRTKQRFIYVGATSADFTADPDFTCFGTEIQFYPDEYADAKTYFWNFEVGETSTEANPKHTFADTGTYEVMLATDDGCGVDTVYVPVTIVPCPTVLITADSTFGCVADGGILQIPFHDASDGNGSNIVNWVWNFPGGDPLSSTLADPLVEYEEAGFKTVILTVTNEAGGTATETFTDFITAYDTPVAEFGANNTSACYSPFRQFIVQFTDLTSGPASSWSWDFGDGTTDTVQHPVHAFIDTGYYSITLAVENPCGVDTITKSDFILVSDLLLNENTFIQVDTLSGPGDFTSEFQFTDVSTAGIITSRSWSVDGTTVGATPSFTYTFDSAATYEIKLITENDCGTASATTSLVVSEL